MPNNTSATPAVEVEALVARWQKCRTEDLPSLFVAFDKVEVQTERVITYSLPSSTITEIIALADEMKSKGKTPRFLTHLGLKDGYLSKEIGDPWVTQFLQVRSDDTERYDNCFELTWEPNPVLPTASSSSLFSSQGAIPGASAFLFIEAWLKTAYIDIAKVFTAQGAQFDRRVKGFRYPQADTEPILATMAKQNATQKGVIYLHIGCGATSTENPFPLRPVLEITHLPTATSIGAGEYYDFASPVPPY